MAYTWVYWIRSDSDYVALVDFIERFKKDAHFLGYRVFEGTLKFRNGREFGKPEEFSLVYCFATWKTVVTSEIKVSDGVKSEQFEYLWNIIEDTKVNNNYLSSKMIFFENELQDYLKKINFKFPDDSELSKQDYRLNWTFPYN